MTPSRKPLALFLTILLVLSTVALSSSTNAEETSARVTNNEEIVVSVNDIYYDRGGDITFTVISSNLDPGTEYNLDWALCNWNGYSCTNEYTSSTLSASGSLDLGSGNMMAVSTITFTDIGPGFEYQDANGDWQYQEGIGNNSMVFKAELNVQGVPLYSNLSEPFVLGGEMYDWGSNLGTISNILKTMDVEFQGNIYMDHENERVLDYTLTCDLFESGGATPVDSVSMTVNVSWDEYSFSSNSFVDYTTSPATPLKLTPTATSGNHYVECNYIRDVDNGVVGTLTSNVFQVIDADVTGNEGLSFQAMSSLYYPRTDDSTSSTITFVVDIDNLYTGTEYTLDWALCNWNGYSCTNEYTSSTLSASGSVSFTATSSGIHSETITFTDIGPGFEYQDANGDWQYQEGIGNNSMVFKAELNVQGVPLYSNLSEPFVLGGEMYDWGSNLGTISNILKTMDVEFQGNIYMDHENERVLDYTLTCDLFESGGATPVDSVSMTVNVSWDEYSFSSNSFVDYTTSPATPLKLTPTATSGNHYVECNYIRDVDNGVVGTLTSNVFQVIDADVTGNEGLSFQAMSSLYYPRTDDSTSSTITFVVDIDNLYTGTEYTLDWALCNWNGYSCTNEYTSSTLSASGSVSFTATSSGIHSETITFTDIGPGFEYQDANGDWQYQEGIGNNSMVFKAELNVQGVPLYSNLSEPFVLGGEMYDWGSNLGTISNILKTMDVEFQGNIYMDHENERVLDYTLTCDLFESGGATPVDSVSMTVNVSWDEYSFSSNSFVDYTTSPATPLKLTPTATSGNHYVECNYIRDVDNGVVGTLTSNVFQVIDDTSNQDDATIVVGSTMNLQEAWGTVTIDAIDLDAGQEYTLDWVVEDYSLSSPTVMMQNDHIWVAGNDGTYTYELEFHDLADTTDACITVVFTAGDDELQVVDNVCWASASTADGDGDGVYDKNDLCPDTSAGLAVTADGCSDSDNDGFDTDLEIDCNTDPNDALSFPTDLDNDGTCDYLDTDTDGDGYLDVDELAVGTDPFDPLSKPANRLPECAVYYNLEIDGIPTSFDGEAAIPALSGVTATTAAASLTPTTVTIPAGSYYITAHCIDPDGDDVTVTVNEITVGPVAGEVSGAVLIEIGEDVDETMDVQITWSDGTDSLTALVTVELDGGSPGLIPGFGTALTIMALLGAGFVLARKDD